MASGIGRLKAIGEAVLGGRSQDIQARVVGQTAIDPDKHVVIERQRLVDRRFDGLRLDSFSAVQSQFERCSFRNIQIQDATWGGGKKQSFYVNCNFDGAQFRSVAPGNAKFVECSFRDVHISEFNAFDVELQSCVFSGRIDKGYLNAKRRARLGIFGRKRNSIFGNDFRDCVLRDFAFRSGVELDRQELPTGDEYCYLADAASALKRGRAIVQAWPEAETKRLALVLLDVIARDLKSGQEQQLVRIPEHGQFAAPAKRLREVLEAVGA